MSPRSVLLLLAALAVPLAPDRGAAQVTTEAGASVLFFPLVVADGERDTLIELANRSTRVVFARCTYTLGGEGGASAETDFELVLVARQATHWVASRGRPVDPTDPQCTIQGNTDCDGAGFDPGAIPPLPEGFRGDLVCVQLDRSRAATSGNALRGVATLIGADGDVAKYEAVGIPGLPPNDADEVLCLGGGASEGCPRGAEYAACPQSWLVNHRAEGVAHGGGPDAPTLRNTLVVATCSRRGGVGAAVVQMLIVNEFEQRFSTSMTVQRWAEIPLAELDIFDREVTGTDFIQTRLRTAPGAGPGIVVIALTERVQGDGGAAGGAVAAVPHDEGKRAEQDRIVLVGE